MNHTRVVIERFIDEELKRGAYAEEADLARQLAEATGKIRENFGDDALDAEDDLLKRQDLQLGKDYLALRLRASGAKSNPELEAEIFNHLYAFFQSVLKTARPKAATAKARRRRKARKASSPMAPPRSSRRRRRPRMRSRLLDWHGRIEAGTQRRSLNCEIRRSLASNASTSVGTQIDSFPGFSDRHKSATVCNRVQSFAQGLRFVWGILPQAS